jgi:4-amino-4-deoxychorismate lyase
VSDTRVWTLVDGSFREGGKVPVTDRGFRYGMSVFETLAVRNCRILFLKQHLAALASACKAAGLRPERTEALSELDIRSDGLLRIYVTAGDGAPAANATNQRTFAFFEPADFPDEKQISRGVRISVAQSPFVPFLDGWKTGNYWKNARALAEARGNGFDDTLILNIQGIVISAAMANVFFLVAGVLQTPAAHAGARRGVVREWLRQVTPVQETLLSLDNVNEAEECFLTNSRQGVMPVSAIDSRRLPSRKVGEALAALYRERILRQ